jgi:glycosyltransferase involved in cell wall biosynthesis
VTAPPILSHRERPHQGRRLLLISPYPPSRTGPAEYAAVFAAQCAARGFQVRVLAEQVPGAPAPTPPPAEVSVDPTWTPDLSGMRRLYAAARDDPSEVVHVNYSFTMYGSSIAGLAALAEFARLSRRHPLVVTLFDVIPKRDLTSETLALYHVRAPPRLARLAVGLILKFLARTADRIVVQSESTKIILESDYGVPSEKIAITELPGYPGPRTVAREPMALGSPDAPSMILYYGFLAPYKGVEVLLAAFARARSASPHRPLRLVVAGTNHPRIDIDFGAKLREEAVRLGLGADEVVFPGYVSESDSHQLFTQSALVVLPYLRTTGASGTLATAMGLDRPVLVSDLPPLVSQLNGYPNSRIVRPGDVAAIADAIGQVAEGRFRPRPPSVVAPGGVRRWEELVDRTAEVYSMAIASHRAGVSTLSSAVGPDADAPA